MNSEKVIALSQTEIMLVLATVILILLIATSDKLIATSADLKECRGESGVPAPPPKPCPNPKPPEPPLGPEPPGDGGDPPVPDLPVTTSLVPGGGGGGYPPLGPEPPDGGDPPVSSSPARTPLVPGEAGGGDAYPPPKLPDPKTPGTEATGESVNESDIRIRIGCLPCWLGDGSPLYYFAFRITYYPRSDSFQIQPHRHLNSDVKVVQDALGGELGILRDHPQGETTREEFLRFSRRVTAARDRLYGNNGCKLMAQINKKGVDGTVIELLRDEAGFCPIWK